MDICVCMRATVAFGMGVNCPKCTTSNPFWSYQSYPRDRKAARDRQPALALLLQLKRSSHHNEKSMQEFASSTSTSRRDLQFRDNYR